MRMILFTFLMMASSISAQANEDIPSVKILVGEYFDVVDECDDYACLKAFTEDNFSAGLRSRMQKIPNNKHLVVLKQAKRQADQARSANYSERFTQDNDYIEAIYESEDSEHKIVIPFEKEGVEWKKGVPRK